MSDDRVKLLRALEAAAARGQTAHARRNTLLVELHADGMSLQQLADELNRARAEHGQPALSKHAVHQAIRRQR